MGMPLVPWPPRIFHPLGPLEICPPNRAAGLRFSHSHERFSVAELSPLGLLVGWMGLASSSTRFSFSRSAAFSRSACHIERMDRTAVTSSRLPSLGYSPTQATLEVEFKARRHLPVPRCAGRRVRVLHRRRLEGHLLQPRPQGLLLVPTGQSVSGLGSAMDQETGLSRAAHPFSSLKISAPPIPGSALGECWATPAITNQA